jgi:hypothetical protein
MRLALASKAVCAVLIRILGANIPSPAPKVKLIIGGKITELEKGPREHKAKPLSE